MTYEKCVVMIMMYLQTKCYNLHIHTVQHLDIIKVLYLPTDAQENCLKNNFKIYIKIDIKTAPTYFGAGTPSSGSALFELQPHHRIKHRCILIDYFTTVTLVSSNNALPDDGDCTETCRSCFNVNFNLNFKIVFKTTCASVGE
jgi:hypothetical protein